MSKLTADKVRQMRLMFSNGFTRKQITEKFDMEYSTTCGIISGRSWKTIR